MTCRFKRIEDTDSSHDGSAATLAAVVVETSTGDEVIVTFSCVVRLKTFVHFFKLMFRALFGHSILIIYTSLQFCVLMVLHL